MKKGFFVPIPNSFEILAFTHIQNLPQETRNQWTQWDPEKKIKRWTFSKVEKKNMDGWFWCLEKGGDSELEGS